MKLFWLARLVSSTQRSAVDGCVLTALGTSLDATVERLFSKMSRKKVAEDEVLIGMVEQYPCLYDHEHKDYKDFQIRENIWNHIGSALSKRRKYCFLFLFITLHVLRYLEN